ncbi:MAG: hypothetical protein KDA79_22235 [Planctomycetaceae bacterium]|nr:hypothetical protein [Planctomycetaceae bacterium]
MIRRCFFMGSMVHPTSGDRLLVDADTGTGLGGTTGSRRYCELLTTAPHRVGQEWRNVIPLRNGYIRDTR